MSYACYRIYDTCDVTKPRSVRVTTTYHDDEHVTYDTCREWERTHTCAHGRIYAYTTPPAAYATDRRNSSVYWSTERYDVLNERDGTNVHGIFGVCATQRAIRYTRHDCMLVTNTTWAILWPYQYVSIAVPDVIIPYEVASNISHRLGVRVLRNNVSTAIVASAITLAAYSYRDINDDMDEYTLLWNSHDVFVFDYIKAQQNSVYAIERHRTQYLILTDVFIRTRTMIIAVIMDRGRRVYYVAVFVSWRRIRAYRLRTTIAYIPPQLTKCPRSTMHGTMCHATK